MPVNHSYLTHRSLSNKESAKNLLNKIRKAMGRNKDIDYDEIRNQIDTKDLTDFQLVEKIRLIDIEVSQMNKELLNLSKKVHDIYEARTKRLKYSSVLKNNLKKRK